MVKAINFFLAMLHSDVPNREYLKSSSNKHFSSRLNSKNRTKRAFPFRCVEKLHSMIFKNTTTVYDKHIQTKIKHERLLIIDFRYLFLFRVFHSNIVVMLSADDIFDFYPYSNSTNIIVQIYKFKLNGNYSRSKFTD